MPARHACKAARSLGVLLAGLPVVLLGGCSDGFSMNPVDWWHDMEGGRLAESRPPPPNADAPYPNLGSVPDKPAPPNQAAHTQIADALVADRRNAEYTLSTSAIPSVPPAGSAQAGLQAPPAPATGDQQPNAALQAANAPPPPPPKKAPVGAVSEAPLAAPPAPAAAPGSAAPASATPAAAAAAMPAIPAAPPAPPQLPGAAPAVVAPTVPPVAPPAPPPAAKPSGPMVPIPFAAGSAVLPADALPAIKQLAERRGTSSIAITGYGGALASDPTAQSAALPLALDRARAVAAQLMANGVPSSAIRIAAEPQGSGAAARLVN